MKTDKLSDKQAARLEFQQEPMNHYYQHGLIGIPSRYRVKKILQELGNIKGKQLLDIGCEAGYITIKLAIKGALVTAVDLIKEPIESLQNTLKKQPKKIQQRIKLQVADAAKLPFKDKTFDIVLATEVIEHITKLNDFIVGAYRVLKPNGILLITFPNEDLRQKLYPIVSLFGIKAEVETQVTLKNYQAEDIIKLFSRKFTLIKHYIFALVVSDHPFDDFYAEAIT